MKLIPSVMFSNVPLPDAFILVTGNPCQPKDT